jgi:HSP20 family molecular chaperone IbpA
LSQPSPWDWRFPPVLSANEGYIDDSEMIVDMVDKEDLGRKRYIHNERSYRFFYRSIRMPEEIVFSKVKAKLNNGLLHIHATNLEEQEGTTIEIT